MLKYFKEKLQSMGEGNYGWECTHPLISSFSITENTGAPYHSLRFECKVVILTKNSQVFNGAKLDDCLQQAERYLDMVYPFNKITIKNGTSEVEINPILDNIEIIIDCGSKKMSINIHAYLLATSFMQTKMSEIITRVGPFGDDKTIRERIIEMLISK